MGNKKDLKWIVILFDSISKKNILKIWTFDTINDVAYILGMPPQDISNFYHKLIKSRDNLRYCDIYQTYKAYNILNI